MSQDILLLRKDLLAELTKEHGLFEPAGKKWSLIFFVVGSILPFSFVVLGTQPGWVLGVVTVHFVGLLRKEVETIDLKTEQAIQSIRQQQN